MNNAAEHSHVVNLSIIDPASRTRFTLLFFQKNCWGFVVFDVFFIGGGEVRDFRDDRVPLP